MPVTLSIHVSDLASTLQLYNRIQIWRCTDGSPTGTYTEITANSPTAAVLDATESGPFTLSGKTLSIVVNGADPVSVTFGGIDPIPLSDVLTQINAVFPDLATLTPNNKLRLIHPLTGTGATLVVTGNAVAVFGLPTAIEYGLGARPLMGLLNDIYKFVDLSGNRLFFYKTRYYSTVTNATSAFSDPFQGDQITVLPDNFLVVGSVNLVEATGAPIIGRRLIIVPVENNSISYNNMLFSMLSSAARIELITDEAGHAEVSLVTGTTVRLFIEGTSIGREFIVPDDDFDMLSIESTQPDAFSIVQAPPMPIRES